MVRWHYNLTSMNNAKWQLNNTSRIQDIKNTRQSQCKASVPTKRVPAPAPAPVEDPTAQQLELRELRNALCEAIEENEFLRERVIELEALLAEAQDRIEAAEEKYVSEMNALQRACESTRPSNANPRSRSL